MTNTMIRVPNAVLDAKYSPARTAAQHDIFYMLWTQLSPGNPVDTHYTIDLNELEHLKGKTINSSHMLRAADGLLSCVMSIYDEIKKKYVEINPILGVAYIKGKRKLELVVNEEFLRFFSFPMFF